MSHYIIYCRKSSESEERQVLSIEAQINELKALAKRLNLNPAEILCESQSAKYPGRPVFNGMMNRVYKNQVKGIVCWKLDRLARNPLDGSAIVWALDQGQIKEIVTPTGTFKNHSNDKFLMQLEFGMAKKYVDDLSDNVRRGNRAKLERGQLPGLAPLGYLNEPQKRTVIKDPERFPLVRSMWNLLLQGVPIAKILTTANDEWGFRTRTYGKLGGKPLARSGLYKTYGSPFYYGLIERKEGVFQGKHEPMITEDEFWKAQEILGRKGKPRPKKHHFAFTGLIRCGECGSMITAEEKINRYGRHYTYYRCAKKKRGPKCRQKYLDDKSMEREIAGYLEKIFIPENLFDIGIDFFMKEREEDRKKSGAILTSREKALNDCQRKLDNLNQMRLKDLMNDQEYIEEKRKLINERIKLEESARNGIDDRETARALAEKAITFSHMAVDRLQNGPFEGKRTILQGIGSNFSLRDKKLCIHVEKPFVIIEKGLERVAGKIWPLESLKRGINKGENALSPAAILSWRATMDDVRTFYEQNPDKVHIPSFDDDSMLPRKETDRKRR